MLFDERKVDQLKRKLSKLNLSTMETETELRKRLIKEFKIRDIDIGTYKFKELKVCKSTMSIMDLNSTFLLMMKKNVEIIEEWEENGREHSRR